MFRLHLIPYGTRFDIVGKSKYFFTLGITVVLTSIAFMLFKGLNYGIDFKGGYIFEVTMPEAPDIPSMRTKLGSLELGEVAIQQFGQDRDLMIKLEKSGEGKEQAEAIQKIKETLGDNVTYKWRPWDLKSEANWCQTQ